MDTVSTTFSILYSNYCHSPPLLSIKQTEPKGLSLSLSLSLPLPVAVPLPLPFIKSSATGRKGRKKARKKHNFQNIKKTRGKCHHMVTPATARTLQDNGHKHRIQTSSSSTTTRTTHRHHLRQLPSKGAVAASSSSSPSWPS